MVFAEVHLIKVYLQFQFLVDMQKWTNAAWRWRCGVVATAIRETDGRADILYRVSRIITYPI